MKEQDPYPIENMKPKQKIQKNLCWLYAPHLVEVVNDLRCPLIEG